VLHYGAGSLPHGGAVATDLSAPLIDFPSSLALGWSEGVDIRVRGKASYKHLVFAEHLTGCWPDRWRQGLIFRAGVSKHHPTTRSSVAGNTTPVA
jgi:hypothetical protein